MQSKLTNSILVDANKNQVCISLDLHLASKHALRLGANTGACCTLFSGFKITVILRDTLILTVDFMVDLGNGMGKMP